MGSLMVGWDKNPWNEERVLGRSKTSLTKEEIEEFWRKRQLAREEHMKEASAQGSTEQQSSSETTGPPSIDIPRTVAEDLELPVAMSPDWWTRSNSAFLNSPPTRDVMGKHSKYTAQFEVATKANRAA